MSMNLKDLVLDTKAVWVDFPGMKGFTVQVNALSRKELTKIRKRCTIQKFDRKTRQMGEELDDERFVSEFAQAAVKNWKGLTLKHLESLILIDMGDKDPETEVPFTKDNAEILVSSSTEFDQFLNEMLFDFRSLSERANAGTVEETE